jgi:hypothetical protein
MASKVLHLFLVPSAQRAVVLGAETVELVVMVVLVVALQMALLEAQEHLARVTLVALAQAQEAV